MAASKYPLPPNKQHHWNIIYDDDNKLARDFVVVLVNKLEEGYCTKCFYCDRDSNPGKSVFGEFFRGVESSIWTIVVVTKGFSKNCWANYCKDADFYTKIVQNNADKLIPIIIGHAEKPKELQLNTPLHFDSDSRNWSDEKFEKLEKILVPAIHCVPVSQTTSAEVTQEISCIYSRSQSQPVTDASSFNSHSLNDQLETDSHAETTSKRQTATGASAFQSESPSKSYSSFKAFSGQNQFDDKQNFESGSWSPSSSSMRFVSLSDDFDLNGDQPLTMPEVQTNAADYKLTTREQAAQNCNPNTLDLRGKSLSMESLVKSQSNEPSESTSPKQILSASDSGYMSGGGMTLAHDNSPSQKNLQREENCYKSDIRVANSMAVQLDLSRPEWNNTSSTDTKDNQMATLEDRNGRQLRSVGMDETEPKNSINANNQERVDSVRGERQRPDDCEIDEAASDSADLKPTSHPSRCNSTIVVLSSFIFKSLVNGFTRTDSFL